MLFIISGCSKVSLQRELRYVESNLRDRFPAMQQVKLQESTKKTNAKGQEMIDTLLVNGVMREQAIAAHLMMDEEIQARIAGLGMVKADFYQAGLADNPNIDFSSAFAKKSDNFVRRSSISLDFSLFISDLWKTRLRKRVAQDILGFACEDFAEFLLEEIARITLLYDECLHLQSLLAHAAYVQQLINDCDNLIVDTVDRCKHICSSADSAGKIMNWQVRLQECRAWLAREIGISGKEANLRLVDQLFVPEGAIPSLSTLQELALKQRPVLLAAQMKIQEAQHRIRYERSRCIKDIQVGVSCAYRSPSSNKTGCSKANRESYIGPLLNFDLPIFDSNSAQIARAKYQEHEAYSKYAGFKNKILQEVHTLYTQYQFRRQRMNMLKNDVIPALMDVIEKTAHYDALQLLKTRLQIARLQEEYFQELFLARKAHVELERAVGSSISHVHTS